MVEFGKFFTVVGDVATLYVESSEPLAPNVEVEFNSVPARLGGQLIPGRKLSFAEKLVAEPVPLRDPPKAKGSFASRIKWKVNLNNDRTLEALTVVLLAKVVGTSRQNPGRRLVALVEDALIVEAITVTEDAKLTRIMLHEFATPEGGSFAFDPTTPKAFIASLSGEQKKLLMQVAKDNPAGRLVVFITFYDPRAKTRLMFADDQIGASMRGNASFTVFFCRDPANGGVTLICHTEHFQVCMINGSTTEWLKKGRDPEGRLANDYMQKSNPKPVQYRIGSNLPTGGGNDGHNGVIWNSIYSANGPNIMPGNHVHGVINTHGCWMLFRNYNWPKRLAKDFDRIYRTLLRKKRGPQALAEITALGYNVATPPTGQSSSGEKYFRFDMNFAHFWFHHEIVGIRYFSDRFYMKDIVTELSSLSPHQDPIKPTVPLNQVGVTNGLAPDLRDGNFGYYSVDHRSGFKSDDSLFRNNVLGFQTAKGFIGFPAPARLSPGVLRERSWADVYFYKEDGLDLSAASPLLNADAIREPGP